MLEGDEEKYSPELTAFLHRAEVQYASITLRIRASSSYELDFRWCGA